MTESELHSIINSISKINFDSGYAYNELFSLFTEDFNMPIIFVSLKKESVGFRTRNNIDGRDFFCFEELSYPDKKYITTYSRANIPGQQLFYISDNIETTIAELLPSWSKDLKIGDQFAITTGEWGFKKEMRVCIIPDFNNDRLKSLLIKSIDWDAEKSLSSYWEFINSFFRAQGITDPNVYKFTSAFCNALFHNSSVLGENVSGILYTSVQHSEGWNLAVLPKFVDDNLELKRVFKLFLRKQGVSNGKPDYDNFVSPTPIFPKSLDFALRKIIW